MADPDGSPLSFSLRETPTVTSIGDPEPVVWATTNMDLNGPTDSTFYPHLAFGADGNLMVVRMFSVLMARAARRRPVGHSRAWLLALRLTSAAPRVWLTLTHHVAALGTGGYVVTWSDSDFKSHGQIVSPAGELSGRRSWSVTARLITQMSLS